MLSLLLLATAGPVLAAGPANLSPAMWDRVQAAEAVAGDLTPTESPQVPETMSLKDCLSLAFTHNAGFRQDQASLVDARRSLWVADQRLFYTATGNAERGRDPGQVVANSFSSDFTTRWQNLVGGALHATAGTGTQIVFGDLVSQRPALGLTYDQALLRGAGSASDTAERLRSAHTARTSQELSYYDAHQQLAQRIIEDYYAVLLAQGQVDIAQRAVDRAQQFYERNDVMFTGKGVKETLPPGVEWRSRVTIMDVGQARLDWERAKQELISAQQDARDATDQLLLDMGAQPGATPKLTSPLVYTPQEYDEAALTQTAVASSTELARLELNRQDTAAARRIARSQARPDLTASVGLNDLGETVGGASLSTGWFSGVALTVPFLERSLRENVGRSDRALQVLEQRRVAARNQVAQDVQRQVRAASSSRARIDIGIQAKQLAEQNREAAKAMFDEGLTDSLRVVDAEQRQVQAERSLLQEQTSSLLTTVRLRRTLGEDITQGWPE
jgi:outer membrane protein TolC